MIESPSSNGDSTGTVPNINADKKLNKKNNFIIHELGDALRAILVMRYTQKATNYFAFYLSAANYSGKPADLPN
jgi:hypothetical protein